MKEKKIPAGKLTNLEEVDGWVSLADLLKELQYLLVACFVAEEYHRHACCLHKSLASYQLRISALPKRIRKVYYFPIQGKI